MARCARPQGRRTPRGRGRRPDPRRVAPRRRPQLRRVRERNSCRDRAPSGPGPLRAAGDPPTGGMAPFDRPRNASVPSRRIRAHRSGPSAPPVSDRHRRRNRRPETPKRRRPAFHGPDRRRAAGRGPLPLAVADRPPSKPRAAGRGLEKAVRSVGQPAGSGLPLGTPGDRRNDPRPTCPSPEPLPMVGDRAGSVGPRNRRRASAP